MNKIFPRGASMVALCLAGAANGATVWNIDPATDGFVGLTNAVANCVNGDSILVGEGVIYLDGPFEVETTGIHIEGAGPDKTIIDGRGQYRGFSYHRADDWNSRPTTDFIGFTVRNCRCNGNGAGASIVSDIRYGDGFVKTYSTISNCVFENCVAFGETGTVKGGGLYVVGAKINPLRDIVIRNCVATNETGSAHGGGIYCAGRWEHPGLSLHRVQVIGCWCKNNGGGAYMEGTAQDVIGCSFVSNACEKGSGGGFYREGHTSYPQYAGVFSNVLVQANVATACGGGKRETLTSTWVDCAFMDNQATSGEAGGLSVVGGDFTRCCCKGNEAASNGGALLVASGGKALSVSDSVFDGNHATKMSGAIYSSGSSAVSIDRCLFLGNSADLNEYWSTCAGCIYSSGAGSIVRNSYFAGNFGAYSTVRGFSLESCTLVDNHLLYDERSGQWFHAAAAAVASSSERLTNCLLYGNMRKKGYTGGAAEEAANVSEYVKGVTVGGEVAHCFVGKQTQVLAGLVYGGETANEELTACPKVVNAAGGDWRPTRTSELREKAVRFDWMEADGALDAGDGTYTIENATVDRTEGIRLTLNNARPRIFGDDPDVGCFEYYCAPGLMLLFK